MQPAKTAGPSAVPVLNRCWPSMPLPARMIPARPYLMAPTGAGCLWSTPTDTALIAWSSPFIIDVVFPAIRVTPPAGADALVFSPDGDGNKDTLP
jgi:hypothetical protein